MAVARRFPRDRCRKEDGAMKKWTMMVSIVTVLAWASVAGAKAHEPADASVVIVSGGTTCPTGTTELFAGSSVVFRNPNNGNLTEDARCWQTAPTETSDLGVLVLGPCVACRLEQ
jgi:hypothetical protein